MNGTDPASLDRLHDIIVPAAVPWLPPAPGWYLLAALVIGLLMLLIVHRAMLWRANAYRRTALAELRVFSKGSAAVAEPRTKLRGAAEILKRTALVAAPREDVASLSGRPWIAWLNEHGGGSSFHGAVTRLLTTRAYQSDKSDLEDHSLNDTLKVIGTWIVRHRIESPDSKGS